MFFNPSLRSAFMFVPGTMGVLLMLISAMMTSISIAREKELGTMEVLLVSPLKPLQIVVGKVIPYVGIAFIDATTIILAAKYIFLLPIHGSLYLLFGELLIFVILSLSLGILISTISSTQQVAMLISFFCVDVAVDLAIGIYFPNREHADIITIS